MKNYYVRVPATMCIGGAQKEFIDSLRQTGYDVTVKLLQEIKKARGREQQR